MRNFAIAAAIAITAAAAAPAYAAELVTNGGFETGDFGGWTQFGNSADSAVVTTYRGTSPLEGRFQAVFGSPGTPGGIFQTLNTVAGQSYRLSIALANLEPASGGDVTSNFAGVSFGGQDYGALFDFDAFPYSIIVFDVTATAATSELRFTFQHDASNFLLDNVSVQGSDVASGVPEPSSWAMMTLGFGALGGALRTRRRRATVTFA